MNAIEIFGWTAAVIGILSNLPQLTRILRARTSAGVSLPLWQLTMATTAAWAVHGFLVQQPQMQFPNVLMSLAGLTLMIFILRDRNQPLLPALVMPVSLAIVLALTDVFLGALIFGILIAAPQLVGQGTQTRELIKAPDLTGVSGVFLAVFLLVQSMWFSFGIMTTDWALITCAGAMVVIAGSNLVIYLVRTSRTKAAVNRQAAVEVAG